MARLKESPRLRAALLAVLSTLAFTAIAAPGVASAADAETVTNLACETEKPVAHSRMGCVVTVTSTEPGSGAPTGDVTLDVFDPVAGDFFGPSSCTLKDSGGESNEAACTVVYESRTLGEQVLSADYPGAPGFQESSSLLFIETTKFGRPTITEPDCDVVTLGSAGFCDVTVRGFFTGTIGHPLGPVTLTASGPVEFSSSTCELVADIGSNNVSRCHVRYAPLAFGPLTVTAEYPGEPRVHGWSNGATTVPVKGVFQVP